MSVSRTLSHEASMGTPPFLLSPKSSGASTCSSRWKATRILATHFSVWAVDQAMRPDYCAAIRDNVHLRSGLL